MAPSPAERDDGPVSGRSWWYEPTEGERRQARRSLWRSRFVAVLAAVAIAVGALVVIVATRPHRSCTTRTGPGGVSVACTETRWYPW